MSLAGLPHFAEYYPAVTGNPNIATPQLLADKIKLNNVVVTRDIYNPDTGELFESDEAFFKMQKEQPGKAIFIKLRPEKWMKQWPHMKDIAIANDSIAYYDQDGKLLPLDAHFSKYGGHPRNAIVFREAREQGIPLMDIVNNASYIPAKYFSKVGLKAMQERGRKVTSPRRMLRNQRARIQPQLEVNSIVLRLQNWPPQMRGATETTTTPTRVGSSPIPASIFAASPEWLTH